MKPRLIDIIRAACYRVKDSVPLSGRVLCSSVFRERRRRDEVEFWVKNRDDGPESNSGWGGITIERRAHEWRDALLFDVLSRSLDSFIGRSLRGLRHGILDRGCFDCFSILVRWNREADREIFLLIPILYFKRIEHFHRRIP